MRNAVEAAAKNLEFILGFENQIKILFGDLILGFHINCCNFKIILVDCSKLHLLQSLLQSLLQFESKNNYNEELNKNRIILNIPVGEKEITAITRTI